MPFDKYRKSRDDKSENVGKKSFKKDYSDKPYSEKKDGYRGERRSFDKDKQRDFNDSKPYRSSKGDSFGSKRTYGNENVNFEGKKDRNFPNQERSERGYKKFDKEKSFKQRDNGFRKGGRKPFENDFEKPKPYEERKDAQVRLRSRKNTSQQSSTPKEPDQIRLNRYIANSGICSRRKADELITSGAITVNDVVVSELGAKVNPTTDKVKYNGQLLKREKMVYVLLNKPKDFITTTEDPQERKTVMELVKNATSERIYPVGRLDRNTTGLLLLTNDGDLAEKLSHPRNNITKIYNVELSKNLTQGDFNKIAFGVELEDGFIKPDAVSYVSGGTKKEIGIQIHSGKNRIVRRIFESLGYEVEKLDRVIYANLTKKDLTRGKWRFLTENEIIQLKHFIK
ncbi:RNA-binding S4 domain protein [Pseudopedobacter saltans DSM 12145]|uniref:Pseudouridine synthase n=1 Tax=Pseudopedobacter saltans (strain ATCC 51119 / DSM 12145 / JCM 21818 / CCUG 39354 / LMG 10337 / NBRC 100064 / NCIMB 13643) TaxID=762903 RepID=F0SE68_PSESL|nr:pseudouridine synthase [Pseudopedobacter saltans]ADY53990.1 RNA-binding S4 domain protein [Pseudopedobacter saltans DSM 12145]